ncbi:peptidase M20 [Thermodesulfatator indicus DSM 15286]|uniref:Peptidase M20 n=1 Tax=Thermodesulfatator indicus (strain DSM 15286 / JCM 11887 / CIR29812) TaxID=667014 RepID=F8AD94_THEID|nr:M20/M25/M40 family metallo-hydrolase [Thermodesulfatator indicus]AEH44828.1 peptidase M20 [Thermodesulfatator indicus DSM 15286]
MDLKNRFKELIFTLASIPSPSGEERAILEYLWGRLSQMNIPLRKQEVPDRFWNIIVNESPENKLLITTHVDTVPPWLGVFPPRMGDGHLEGLGVCDDKAGVAIMLMLLEERLRQGKPIPATFAFVVDEEREGQGSAMLAREPLPPYAVVLEPTDLKIAIAEGGSVEFEIRVKGKAVHGSCIPHGENAIERAIELVSKLKRLSFLYTEHPLVGPGGFNVERFTGGDGELRVPDQCIVEIDFRVLPGQETQDVINEIKQILDETPNVHYVIKDISEPFAISTESPIVKKMCEAYRRALKEEPELSGMPSWTDAAHLFAAGVEPVVFGPGDLSRCHTPEEIIELVDVVEAFLVLDSLLDIWS